MPRATLLFPVMLAGTHRCSADPFSEPCRPPDIIHTTVSALPHNVLGAIVTVESRLADSVAVRFGLAGQPLDSVTPAVPAAADPTPVPVLGLLPGQSYALQATAFGCSRLEGSVFQFPTGALPSDLPNYQAGGPDPSPGYVVFGAGAYGLVIDNTGRVVWYHRFPRGPGLNFQAQPNGRYVARPPSPEPDAGFIEVDVLGGMSRTLGCTRSLPARFHDLYVEPDGGYWLMCDEARPMNLSAWGGRVDAMVLGTTVQHLDPQGRLLFEWSPFDHFSIDDLPPADRTAAVVNWTHGNAIDLDPKGYLLVSFRSLSEITRIDVKTGAVSWRMGGRANQFTFIGTPMPAFSAQHGVRTPTPDRLVLLDNLGEAGGSRAERYLVDEVNRMVRLESSFAASVPTVAQLGGTTQSLPGGRVLVSYGNGARVEEYDADGRVVWAIQGNSGYVFRAQRVASLYRPGVGDAR